MSITQEEFEALVSRLEKFAPHHPTAYKLRVLALALLGYAYIFSIVVLLLGLILLIGASVIAGQMSANFLIIKVAGVLLILTGIILRSLWVKIEPPTGLNLDARKRRCLEESIAVLQTTLKAPPIHHLLLTDEFNASISQIPRLGAFGWYENYLCIGLPLLQTLSPDQFRAVIAHEMGHLSGAHGRFSSWIYRVRATWVQLLVQLEERQHWGSFIFVKFFESYAPYFAAYSFVLARAQEYEADQLAAEQAGKENLADALIRLEVGGAYLQETFWPSVYQKADHEPDPPTAVYTDMQQALRSNSVPEFAQEVLKYVVAVETGSDDTHPALADRLAALGVDVRPVLPVPESAAEHYFGEDLGEISAQLSRRWKDQTQFKWHERYRYSLSSQESLQKLEKKAKDESLTTEEAWQRAYWTEEFHSSEAALPLYQDVLRLQADHADALFSVGRILLSQDDQEGVGIIDKAMRLQVDYTYPGCQIVCSFLLQKGKEEEAREFVETAMNRASSIAAAT